MLGSKAKRELKRNQRRILIDSIEIGIPSPQQIYAWGERRLANGKRVGEIKNSKTVNYKRFTPLRDGLFCERIFGPVNSFVCACGKRQPRADVTFCDKCEVEYTDQRTRRYRLGYIPLISPVAHIWYLKGRPSYLSLFLGKRKKKVIALAYCNAYLVEQSPYQNTRPSLHLAPTDVMSPIQEREAHGVNKYTKNIKSSLAIRHISNLFYNSPKNNSRTSKNQSLQASLKEKILQLPEFTKPLINTTATNKSSAFINIKESKADIKNEKDVYRSDNSSSSTTSAQDCVQYSSFNCFQEKTNKKTSPSIFSHLLAEVLGYIEKDVVLTDFSKRQQDTNINQGTRIASPLTNQVSLLNKTESQSESVISLRPLWGYTYSEQSIQDLHNLDTLVNRAKTSFGLRQEKAAVSMYAGISTPFKKNLKSIKAHAHLKVTPLGVRVISKASDKRSRTSISLSTQFATVKEQKYKDVTLTNKVKNEKSNNQFSTSWLVKHKIAVNWQSVTKNLYFDKNKKIKTVLNKSVRKDLTNVRPHTLRTHRKVWGQEVTDTQANLSSSTHAPSLRITAQTPQRILNPYNRAHTLPFLPSLICKYNLRDELLNLLNSSPLIDDRPIAPYCQLERWQALQDVHQFMSEQVLSQSTEGGSSQKSTSENTPHRNQPTLDRGEVQTVDTAVKTPSNVTPLNARSPYGVSREQASVKRLFNLITQSAGENSPDMLFNTFDSTSKKINGFALQSEDQRRHAAWVKRACDSVRDASFLQVTEEITKEYTLSEKLASLRHILYIALLEKDLSLKFQKLAARAHKMSCFLSYISREQLIYDSIHLSRLAEAAPYTYTHKGLKQNAAYKNESANLNSMRSTGRLNYNLRGSKILGKRIRATTYTDNKSSYRHFLPESVLNLPKGVVHRDKAIRGVTFGGPDGRDSSFGATAAENRGALATQSRAFLRPPKTERAIQHVLLSRRSRLRDKAAAPNKGIYPFHYLLRRFSSQSGYRGKLKQTLSLSNTATRKNSHLQVRIKGAQSQKVSSLIRLASTLQFKSPERSYRSLLFDRTWVRSFFLEKHLLDKKRHPTINTLLTSSKNKKSVLVLPSQDELTLSPQTRPVPSYVHAFRQHANKKKQFNSYTLLIQDAWPLNNKKTAFSGDATRQAQRGNASLITKYENLKSIKAHAHLKVSPLGVRVISKASDLEALYRRSGEGERSSGQSMSKFSRRETSAKRRLRGGVEPVGKRVHFLYNSPAQQNCNLVNNIVKKGIDAHEKRLINRVYNLTFFFTDSGTETAKKALHTYQLALPPTKYIQAVNPSPLSYIGQIQQSMLGIDKRVARHEDANRRQASISGVGHNLSDAAQHERESLASSALSFFLVLPHSHRVQQGQTGRFVSRKKEESTDIFENVTSLQVQLKNGNSQLVNQSQSICSTLSHHVYPDSDVKNCSQSPYVLKDSTGNVYRVPAAYRHRSILRDPYNSGEALVGESAGVCAQDGYVLNTEMLETRNASGKASLTYAGALPCHVSATKQKAKKVTVSANQSTLSRQGHTFSSLELTTIREILSYTGGGALQKLLQRFDTQLFASFLFADIKATRAIYKQKVLQKGSSPSRIQKRILTRLCRRISKNSRRLKIAQLLTRCKRRPEWMMISILPVLPPDLRPILQMSESVVVASDLNNLYQRVVYRNNRFYKLNFIDFSLVTAIQRLVQDAVDRLIENGKGGSKPFYTPSGRPLKSLSDTLKGKKGRFRLNLLGKRVDFSGRSVIVVSPTLRIHECGLPREIALELYHYFLLRQLMLRKQASSIIMAKKIIQQRNAFVWDVLRDIVYHHPVLLNRAPTLHRLGIQAFQPKLVKGNAILLNPLVCSGFNADFDGDQMGVHLPLSTQARAEAWDLLWSRNNLLSPATGQPVLIPSQDMVLGFYYMTQSFSSRSLVKITDHKKDVLLERQQKDAHSFAAPQGQQNTLDRSTKKLSELENNLSLRNYTPKDRRRPTARELATKNRVFFNCLELLQALQNKNIHLHTPVWLQWQGKMENDETAQIPLELRINHFGSSTYIYSKHKRRKDESLSKSTLYIRTTAGRVLVNSILFS
uniref:RNA polymerase beta' subunit n=1 Tax=Phyllosiphon coccidium TaxID=1837062 RepID=UPI0024117CF5|nr:RNA polymerase beta' subunit [Phyllosiphon coccidium]WDY12735.1 RNA polymerase beta' subunit [Phyllosiphon coccidium]